MTLLVHRARLLDCNGTADDSWLFSRDGAIVATGVGDTWREQVAIDGTTPSADDVVVYDADGRWVTPGFIDLHLHGGGGHSCEDGSEAIAAVLAAHREHGTTRALVSLVSSPVAELCGRLGEVAAACQADPRVLGAHLEGPFLSPEHRGAHDASALATPDPESIDQLVEAGRGWLRHLTLAPELPGALAAIGQLLDAGVLVAVGHTSADYTTATTAFDHGARLLTHAYNAMPGIHHRAPGPVAAALDNTGVVLEIINDGVHVAPAITRMTLRAAPGRVAFVSDAMAAAGADEGDYRLGGRDVAVRDGVATLAGSHTLAGSTLTLDNALRNAVAAGVDPAIAVGALTSTPAGVLGLGNRLGQLRPGFAADLVVLDSDWRVARVFSEPVGV